MQMNQGYLEKMRLEKDPKDCRSLFESACKQSSMRGSALLNDKSVTFPTLYLLFDSIKTRLPYLRLSSRNIHAVKLISAVKSDKTGNSRIRMLAEKQPAIKNLLFWAVQTGYDFDGDSDFDYIMDIFICVLINAYGMREVLPMAESLIFRRSRQGKNIHDLIWAYFQIQDPETLSRLCEHLKGNEQSEIELAKELLDVEHTCKAYDEPERQYKAYKKWLSDNSDFLYFTNESPLYSGSPRICRVDRERKYLQKSFKNTPKNDMHMLKKEEQQNLKDFRSLCKEDQECICCFSNDLRSKQGENQWKEWMRSPISEKLKQANANTEENI